jgi:CubicO group peptidase (beta-lactamase class C family)
MSHRSWFPLLAVGYWMVVPSGLPAQGLSAADPERMGVSVARLRRIDALMEEYVERGLFPGMTVAVARKGRLVYFKSFGFMDIEARRPIADDAVFRIYSMTKPVTAAAVMILHEEGRFRLEDPVADYIPEFGKVRVGPVEYSDGPASPARPMTVRDLLRHTSGLGYGWEDDPIGREYRKLNLFDLRSTLAEMVAKLASAPLYFHPGTQWGYGTSIDVLGRLVEIWSGRDLDEFLRDRVFRPLDMRDTGFHLAPGQLERLTRVYRFSPEAGLVSLPEGEALDRYRRETSRLLSGGGGLVSTTSDYLRFAQMLLNGGELDGVRILAGKTVELMSMDHLPEGVRLPWDKLQGHGYGFAVSVLTRIPESPTVGTIGDYGWDGAASTYFRVDPAEDLVILLMTHRMPCDTEIQVKLKTLVYQALIE